MTVNYDNFAKTFSKSRKNMKWEEIEYFISFLSDKKDISILDIWCGNWRLLFNLKHLKWFKYLWVDLSRSLLDEAKKNNPNNDFVELDMIDISNIKQKFSFVFLIASFHHLNTIKQRKKVLKNIFKLLKDNWIVFLTNWSLNGEFYRKKYTNNIITWSENEFLSMDYNIKIWDYSRYYHWFNINELKYLFEYSGFKIIENREFNNKKNFISILKKNETK